MDCCPYARYPLRADLETVKVEEDNMPSQATVINLGGVNCYLLSAGDGYVLIDTGLSGRKAQLAKSLESEGCRPGNLKLILLTHGDSDHTGNCAFLRGKYNCKIAMHNSDLGMVECGDMSFNRKAKPDKMSPISRFFTFIVRIFFKGASRFEKFTPDIMIDEGFDLSKYGLNAKILHMPGHSKGSIGVLTDDGKLFCGDFVYNMPGFEYIDDLADHVESMEKLIQLKVETIYPGHGKPFPMSVLIKRA
jgi:glyoxylase-like metal-dependent hydrolase (beta-lactamase superfamily II)